MTNVNTDIATVAKLLGAGNGAEAGSNLAAVKGGRDAFSMELMMANKLWSEPSADKNIADQNMDMGIMNNLLMLEALTALNAVKSGNSASGTNRPLQGGYGKSSSAFPAADVKKMSPPQVSGSLSAGFESGGKGSSAIGYDRVGGTSYGKYQIASKTGSMDSFIKFLKDKAPEIANQLLEAGPADTGSKGGRMPEVWKKIAGELPQGFEQLQHDFIRNSHYDPAAKMIQEKTGVDMNSLPGPVREVLWSTSVQHGATGASKLIARAIDKLASSAEDKGFPADLVREIYGERKGQFSSSTGSVQKSVGDRFRREESMVLAMLGEGISKTA